MKHLVLPILLGVVCIGAVLVAWNYEARRASRCQRKCAPYKVKRCGASWVQCDETVTVRQLD